MVSHNIATETAALTSVMLMGAFVCGHLINVSKLKNIPQSTAAIVIGMVSGLLFYLNPKLFGSKSLLRFNPELFYMFMLPPIILEAGFSMDRINFMKNFHSIMWLAIGGTLITAIVTGALLYLVVDYVGFEGGAAEQLLYCALLGTLLAAVDPVATLGVLGGSRFEANEKLFSIVFGESLLNDSVSIVVFRTLIKAAPIIVSHEPHPWKLLYTTMASFLYVTLISCVIGALTGVMAYLAYKLADGIQRFPEYELGVLLLIAYFSFSFAELVDGSGIVSLFITAVLLGHYNIKNLSPTSQRSSVVVFKVLSVFSEAFIYLLFGTVFTQTILHKAPIDWGLCMATAVALMVSRAVVIFPSAAVINVIEERYELNQQESVEKQVLAEACLHAVFEKSLTSRYTPLAKSMVSTIDREHDTPLTQVFDEDNSTNVHSGDYQEAEQAAPICIPFPRDENYSINVVHCTSHKPPPKVLMPALDGGRVVERPSFVTRLSASEILQDASPRAWRSAEHGTPRPAAGKHVNFESGSPTSVNERCEDMFRRLPGQRITEYLEELRAYRAELKERNRLYTKVLDLPCQVLLWMSGLRGAIAFVLALSVPDLGTASGAHNAKLIVSTTLAVIVVTTVAFGSVIELFALKYNIIRRVDNDEHTNLNAKKNHRWRNTIKEGCRQLWHSLRNSPYRHHKHSPSYPADEPLLCRTASDEKLLMQHS